MKIGYPELLLVFSAVISFQDFRWGLAFAALSLTVAFFRFAIEIQEKKEKKQELENTAKILNEQAEELGSALSKLFSNVKSEVVNRENNKKYH